MQAVRGDPRAPEPELGNPGAPAGLGRTSPTTGALEEFAQNVAETVIQAFFSQMEMMEPAAPASNGDQETLAGALASAVMEAALREACGGCGAEGFQRSPPPGGKMDYRAGNRVLSDGSGSKTPVLNADTETDAVAGLIHANHPPLAQSGLPVLGSLDYPDAPPTSPLLPELERSRHSFSRKLKGGLAKVFLPSPPPPTPKDEEDEAGSVGGPRPELMEHLMHSLCTDELARDDSEAGPQRSAKMEAFAEVLSRNIVDRALSAKSRERRAVDGELHLLARRLAAAIITSSLDEAKVSA